MEYRCPHCRKLLFLALRVLGLEIKCPRCGRDVKFGNQPEQDRQLPVATARK
jgi:phage FluMu protein Com